MTTRTGYEQQHRYPVVGLVALAVTLSVYVLNQFETWRPSALSVGLVLLAGGGVQLFAGVRSHQQGRIYAAATMLPLGIFWLSLISYDIFPELGLGRHPNSITMFSYLSLWGLFVAILFLGSFRQNLTVQTLYGSMMFSFLALAMDHLRGDQVFLVIGCFMGSFASVVAVYMAFAQFYNEWTGRTVLPLGETLREDEDC
jgi:hypothetical protein